MKFVKLILIMFICTLSGVAQTMSNGVITKENLLSALKYGKVHRNEKKSASWYVAKIKAHKVDFQLSLRDERKVCYAGDYLGSKGLDALIEAIRDNYHEEKGAKAVDEEKEPKSIKLDMTNSPGGVQIAGDHNVVNQAPPARTFTAEQYAEIVRYLRGRPKTSVTVLSTMTGGQEAADFANLLFAVLKNADWTMETAGPGVFSGSFKGIWICAESEQNLAAGSLQHALTTFGFMADGQRWANVGEKVTLIVGGRP